MAYGSDLPIKNGCGVCRRSGKNGLSVIRSYGYYEVDLCEETSNYSLSLVDNKNDASGKYISYTVPELMNIEIILRNEKGNQKFKLVHSVHLPGQYRIEFNTKSLMTGRYTLELKREGEIMQSINLFPAETGARYISTPSAFYL